MKKSARESHYNNNEDERDDGLLLAQKMENTHIKKYDT